MKRLLHRRLLWLWKIVPFPLWARRAFLQLIASRFLIGALGIIEDEQGRVLFVRQTYKRQSPWGLPGGWIKSAESVEQGLAREVAEETGLQVAVGPVVSVRPGPYGEIVIVYRCSVLGGRLSPDPLEIAELAFFPDEMPPDAAPMYLEIVRHRHPEESLAAVDSPAAILCRSSTGGQHMQDAAAIVLEGIRDVHRKLREEISDLDGEALHWTPGQETNSLAILITHMLGSELEALGRARGLPIDRDRASEFVPREDARADLLRRIAAADAALDEHGAALTEADLGAVRAHPTYGSHPGFYWLIRTFGHLREHLAHLQLTRQLYLQQRGG